MSFSTKTDIHTESFIGHNCISTVTNRYVRIKEWKWLSCWAASVHLMRDIVSNMIAIPWSTNHKQLLDRWCLNAWRWQSVKEGGWQEMMQCEDKGNGGAFAFPYRLDAHSLGTSSHHSSFKNQNTHDYMKVVLLLQV